jgi:uncharacterized protein YdaU (DUF1376 family)
MGELRWYKRDPAKALKGMQRLNLEQRGAYNTILDLIYLHDGKLIDDDRFLAGNMGADIRKWRNVKKQLLALGRISIRDGYIHDDVADVEAEVALNRIESARHAGQKSAEARRAKREDVPLDPPEYSHESKPTTGMSVSEVKVAKSGAAAKENNDLALTTVPTKREQTFEPLELDKSKDIGADAPLSETSSDALPPKPLRRKRKAYPEAFEAFWQAYPIDPLMSKAEAGKQWDKLTDEDRAAAMAAVPSFAAHCRQDTTYRPVHACRFLSQRRFDGFVGTTAPNGAGKPKPMDSDPEIIRRRAEHAALEKARLARLAKEMH